VERRSDSIKGQLVIWVRERERARERVRERERERERDRERKRRIEVTRTTNWPVIAERV